MREIKFRAWDKDRNEWFHCGEIHIDMQGNIYLDGGEKPYNERFEIEWFTGLKDKNGTEIYEGDICLAALPDERFPVEVVWYETKSGFLFRWNDEVYETGKDEMDMDLFTDIEVIGNIHENPKLLEDKK